MITLHRAPFVVPVSAQVIEDGGVLCQKGQIIQVDKFKDLPKIGAAIIDHENYILAPGLINGHTHLELSHLSGLGKADATAVNGDITFWIRNLLSERQTDGENGEHIQAAADKALKDLQVSGCAVVADIGNLTESRFGGQGAKVRVLFFLEMLGFSKSMEEMNLKRLCNLPQDLHCAAHAPYSTSPKLIFRSKEKANSHGAVLPIHVAESSDEITFLMNGTGKIKDFLIERDAWDESFSPPRKGAVAYLDDLGVLDNKTLCVHVVHVSDDEIEILAKRQAKVCLCPGSNRYMGVGKAPVKKILEHGLQPALGTDSLASNSTLNVWREMRLLAEDHPEIGPKNIFSMATKGGADALEVGGQYGTLAPGKSSKFLAVQYDENLRENNIYEFLVNKGETVEIKWVQ